MVSNFCKTIQWTLDGFIQMSFNMWFSLIHFYTRKGSKGLESFWCHWKSRIVRLRVVKSVFHKVTCGSNNIANYKSIECFLGIAMGSSFSWKYKRILFATNLVDIFVRDHHHITEAKVQTFIENITCKSWISYWPTNYRSRHLITPGHASSVYKLQ